MLQQPLNDTTDCDICVWLIYSTGRSLRLLYIAHALVLETYMYVPGSTCTWCTGSPLPCLQHDLEAFDRSLQQSGIWSCSLPGLFISTLFISVLLSSPRGGGVATPAPPDPPLMYTGETWQIFWKLVVLWSLGSFTFFSIAFPLVCHA